MQRPLQQSSDLLTTSCSFVRIQDQVQCTLSYQKNETNTTRCQLVELSSCDPRQLERLRFVIYKKATRHVVEPLLALLAGFGRWSKKADRPIDSTNQPTNQKQINCKYLRHDHTQLLQNPKCSQRASISFCSYLCL